eukprot:COSAG01_NODE_4653_length_4846_cov_2.561197_4_plen_73_part_00
MQAAQDTAAASRCYAASVRAWPGQSEAHYWLAQAALAAGDLDEAERLLRRAAAAGRGRREPAVFILASVHID